MKAYLNLSTRAKLFTAFGLMSVLAAATILFAYSGLSAMRQTQRHLIDVEMANRADLRDIRANHHGIRANVAQLMLTSDSSHAEALRDDIQTRSRQVQAALTRIGKRMDRIDADRDLLREFDTVRTASMHVRDTQILPLIAGGKIAEARALFTGAQQDRDHRLAEITDELVDRATREANESVAASERQASDTLQRLMAIAALTLLAGIGLTQMLAKALASPMRTLSTAAERIAAGDLSVELPDDGRQDETGMLTRTFRQMSGRLREMMREIGEGVTVLASSASEITASTSQVAASSAETASSVAQTSATAEEVKQTARVASDKAQQVLESAQKSVEASQGGLQAMNQSIESMHQIRQQMDSMAQSILRLADQGLAIGEIIATVNDVADQAKLLSVNAAIEAARAGEEGAGFRVVAQEIRSLAEQSKQATAQVTALLGEIQKATSTAVMTTEQANKAVHSGVDLSENAARSIRAMAETIHASAQAAAQIAASAQQQTVGMDQVAYAMQNINQASAQNVAASRQTEAAAYGLQQLGQRLKAIVEQYRT